MKKGRMLGRQVSCALSFAVAWAAVCSVSAEDLYFCPNADGKGLSNWNDAGNDFGWYIGKGNWTNALGAVKTPTASDVVWFNQAVTNTVNGRGAAKNVSPAAAVRWPASFTRTTRTTPSTRGQ